MAASLDNHTVEVFQVGVHLLLSSSLCLRRSDMCSDRAGIFSYCVALWVKVLTMLSRQFCMCRSNHRPDIFSFGVGLAQETYVHVQERSQNRHLQLWSCTVGDHYSRASAAGEHERFTGLPMLMLSYKL